MCVRAQVQMLVKLEASMEPGVLISLVLKLPNVGSELGSSTRGVSALHSWAIFSALLGLVFHSHLESRKS